jgi:hypothetical protein
MIREGDNFDYCEWLKRVREQEAEATKAVSASGELNVARIDDSIKTKLKPFPRALRWPHRQAKSQTTKVRLRHWLEKVRSAWDDFQANRTRDAVYGYLEAVFAIVMRYKVRRRTSRLLRHAFEFANLPPDQNADPFTAIIRCTSDV